MNDILRFIGKFISSLICLVVGILLLAIYLIIFVSIVVVVFGVIGFILSSPVFWICIFIALIFIIVFSGDGK